MKTVNFPYKYFDSFIEAFFIEKKSFLTDDSIDIRSFSLWDNLINKITFKKDCSEGQNSLTEEVNSTKKLEADELPKVIEGMGPEEQLVLLHAYWLWYYPFGSKTSVKQLNQLFGNELCAKINTSYLENEIELASMATYASLQHNEVRWLLTYFFKKYWNTPTDIKSLKNAICEDFSQKDDAVSSRNLILHILKPEEYEPIAKNDDKGKIADAFSKVLDINKDASVDEKLRNIREKLELGNSSFYSEPYASIWKDNIMSPTGKLEYKKAMILYGPPGTGKTYTAIEMAKRLLAKQYIKKGTDVSENLKYLQDTSDEDFLKNDTHIKYLQFHVNYNYENFIAGQTIEKSDVKTKLGFIFDVIAEAKAGDQKDMPFVVILDEINRTDISRVFGELFTAIEKRGKDVVLSIPDPSNDNKLLVLNVPENIYFIGTMNEIDFSLERVDFALRRRFIWEYCGYNKEALRDIIQNRLKKYGETISQETITEYINSCNRLNEVIKNNPYLGESYHIGHAFFAEIADVYHHLDNTENNKRWKNAKRILWDISIKPTLDAYCGSMEKTVKDNFLKDNGGDFYTAFWGKSDAIKKDTENKVEE